MPHILTSSYLKYCFSVSIRTISDAARSLGPVVEKLLTYALGRGLDASDSPALRAIKRGAATNEYRFASLVQQIVVSTPFTERLSVEVSN